MLFPGLWHPVYFDKENMGIFKDYRSSLSVFNHFCFLLCFTKLLYCVASLICTTVEKKEQAMNIT